MFFIFGTRNREKRIAGGEFFCPACLSHSSYHHLRVARYFTLYFIPIFPFQTLGEFVRCLNCHKNFNTTVLQMTREQIEAQHAPWKCPFCNNTNAGNAPTCLSCHTPRLPAAQQ